jgi:RNA polymerase sigma factor (sigma-70 family)
VEIGGPGVCISTESLRLRKLKDEFCLPLEAGDRSMDRQRLIESHMPFARSLAREMRREGVDLDDLTGQGYLALVEAANTYDPEHYPDVSFAAYAKHRIAKRIREALDAVKLFRGTRKVERASAKCAQARVALIAAGESSPTLEAIAAKAGLEQDLCREAMSITASDASIESFGVMPEFEDHEQRELLGQVEEVLDQECTAQGRLILVMASGSEGPSLTFGQIARRLGLTLREVRSVHDDACSKVGRELRRRGLTAEVFQSAIAG